VSKETYCVSKETYSGISLSYGTVWQWPAEQALESEFMAALHDEEDEPRAKAALVLDVRLDPPASGPSNQLSTLV
jgi:hypothetical protein